MLSDADLVESSIRIELQHRTTWQRTRQLFFPPTHFRWRGGKQKPQETVTFQGVDIWLRGQDLLKTIQFQGTSRIDLRPIELWGQDYGTSDAKHHHQVDDLGRTVEYTTTSLLP